MSTELIMIIAFVIVTFLFLQIVKVRNSRSEEDDLQTGSSEVSEAELLEVSEFQENATSK